MPVNRRSALRVALLSFFAFSLGAQPLPPQVIERLEPAPNSARRAFRPAYRATLAEPLFDASSVAHFVEAKRNGKPVRLRLNVAPGLDLPVSIQSAQFWPESGSVSWTGSVDAALPGSFGLAITDGQLNGYVATGSGRIFDITGTVNQAEITEVDPASFRLECPSSNPPGEPAAAAAESFLRDRQLPGPASILDVLVVYSAAARTAAGSIAVIENQIRETFAYTNQAYANTGLALRINLVGTREVTYTENGLCSTALDRITNTTDGVMDDVAALRDQTGADLVSLWVHRGDCGGVAWVMRTNDQTFARNAYSVTITESSTFWRNVSFAHELGHNMGSTHDRANSSGQGLFPFSYGYQSTEAQPFFRDIMAYGCANVDCPTQPYFSSPDILVLGRPIGLPASNPSSADAAQTFTLSAPTIEAFRPRGGTSVPIVLNPPTRSVPVAGGTFSVGIATTASWQAVSQASWITGLSPASGAANATLNYQVAANGSGALRRGSIQIGGTTHVVEQAFSISCPTAPVALGTSTNGALSASSCISPLRGNTRAARFSFAGVAGQQIAVQLSSTAFDTYLYLVRPDGTVLAEGDDGGGGTNSRIPAGTALITLPTTGTYLIEATAFDAAATGAFTLTTIIQTVACIYSINPTTLNEAAAGVQRNVAVAAPAGCGWTAVSQASWIGVASNTSGAGNADVRLEIAANNTGAARTGTATIAGRTLTVNQAALTSCTASPITVGVTVSGSLSAASPCRSTFRSAGTFAARYTFAGTVGQTVQIVLESPTVDTYLYLLNPAGGIVDEDDDSGGGGNSAIPSASGVLTLPASGTYTIEATSYNSGAQGSFTLKLLNPAASGLALLHNTPSTLNLPAFSGNYAQLFVGTAFHRYINVPVGATRLEIRLRSIPSTADVDLFVRRGTLPAVSSDAVVADYRAEGLTGDETIVITPASNPPLQPGVYYVSLGLFTPNVAVAATLTALFTPGPPPVVPSVTSTGPIFTSGATQTVTLRFSHPAGVQELGILNALINRALDGGTACYIACSQRDRVLYLVSDAGPTILSNPLTLGATGSVSNGQCTIFSAGSSVSTTATELTLTLNVAFSSGFSGNRIIYIAGRTVAELNSGWQPQGIVAVPETTPPFPRSGSLSPATGTAPSATVTATFLDATNANSILVAWLLINSAVDGRGACYVTYYRPDNLLLLVPDNGDGNAASAIPLSGNGFLENSQCRISAQGSSVSIVGNTITLNLNVSFKSVFAGPRIIFGALQSNGVSSGWKPLGAWQVPP